MKPYTSAILCIALLFAGLSGCSNEPAKTQEEHVQANLTDLRDTLRSVVKDPARLEQMLVIVDQESDQLISEIVEFEKLRKEDVRLNANYHASREEFEQLGKRIQSVREQFENRLIKARIAIAQLATDDEWEKITSRDLAILHNSRHFK